MKHCKSSLSFSIVALFLLLHGVSSRGIISGRGNNGNSSRINSGGLKSASQIKSPPTNSLPNNPQSKGSGAYLIPAGGSMVFPIYRNPKAQEVTSYTKREGTGMSAWGIVALILGIVGTVAASWFCYMVGLPIWRDRHRRNGRNSSRERRPPEAIALQATPSTATPSP